MALPMSQLDRRGRGVGARPPGEREFEDMGARGPVLGVVPGNAAAIRLYQRRSVRLPVPPRRPLDHSRVGLRITPAKSWKLPSCISTDRDSGRS